MVSVTVEQIQQNPLKYLHQVEAGEALVIVRGDRPIAELKPIKPKKGEYDPLVYVLENLLYPMTLMHHYLKIS